MFKRLRIRECFSNHRLPKAISLLVNHVLLECYKESEILKAISEPLLQPVNDNEEAVIEDSYSQRLLEDLIFRNSTLTKLYSSEISLPSLVELSQIIERFKKMKIEFEHESHFMESIPSMIIYQVLVLVYYHVLQVTKPISTDDPTC